MIPEREFLAALCKLCMEYGVVLRPEISVIREGDVVTTISLERVGKYVIAYIMGWPE